MGEILRITDLIPSDDSIVKCEHSEYEPVTGTNLNNSGGDIRIYIEIQYLFTHPSESFLVIEGRLPKADGTAYANADAFFSKYSVRTFGSGDRKSIVSGSSDNNVGFVKICGRFFLYHKD